MKNSMSLAVAVVLGVLGFAAMVVVMNRSSAVPDDAGPMLMKRIVVATKDLNPGTKLHPSHIDLKDIPAEHFIPNAHIEESLKANFFDWTVRTPIKEGQPVLVPALEKQSSSAPEDVESRLKYPESLAMSIALDVPGSVAGLIKPGQKVDVIGTFDVEANYLLAMGDKIEKEKETATRTLLVLQNRTVLAVDVAVISRPYGEPREATSRIVTLALTPEEALKLAMLQAKGRAHLALRNGRDETIMNTPPMGPADLFPNGISANRKGWPEKAER